jgi:hypothetical protein
MTATARKKKRYRVSIMVAIALASVSASAQRTPQGDALRELAFLSGLGVVGTEIAGEVSCAPNASGQSQVSLFVSIDGPVAATLAWSKGQYGSCQAYLMRNGQLERLYRGWDIPEISYESTAVVYYEQREGFARVFEHTAPPGYWVRIGDMPAGRLRPWSELLVASPRTYRGYEALELHAQPTEDSSVLVTLRERQVHEVAVHQLIPTGELSGAWGRFDVIEFTGDFNVMARTADSAPTGNKWQGWLRLLTPEGPPRFWFYTRD